MQISLSLVLVLCGMPLGADQVALAGHDHDVTFNSLKHYSFAMALFDDSVDNYLKVEALSLQFSRKLVNPFMIFGHK